ncbi:MAG: hypothetical protein J5865_00320 [Lachnospiraceae bacterium]|nr:hypothetical protein [Lachnospiraceae bacterium]
MAAAIHFSLLMIHTAYDLDRKRLPRTWLAFHLGTGLWLAFLRCGLTSLSWVTALIPGLFVMAAGLLTRGSIGTGDGWILMAGGLACGGIAAAEELMLALLLCAGFSLILLAAGKATRKTRLPFAPFLALAELVRLALHGWGVG